MRVAMAGLLFVLIVVNACAGSNRQLGPGVTPAHTKRYYAWIEAPVTTPSGDLLFVNGADIWRQAAGSEMIDKQWFYGPAVGSTSAYQSSTAFSLGNFPTGEVYAWLGADNQLAILDSELEPTAFVQFAVRPPFSYMPLGSDIAYFHRTDELETISRATSAGVVLWTYPLPASGLRSWLTDGSNLVYVVTLEDVLLVIDATGKEMLNQPLELAAGPTLRAATEHMVIMDYWLGLAAYSPTGDLLWKQDNHEQAFNGSVFSHSILTDADMVIAQLSAGEASYMQAYDQTGTQLWHAIHEPCLLYPYDDTRFLSFVDSADKPLIRMHSSVDGSILWELELPLRSTTGSPAAGLVNVFPGSYVMPKVVNGLIYMSGVGYLHEITADGVLLRTLSSDYYYERYIQAQNAGQLAWPTAF